MNNRTLKRKHAHDERRRRANERARSRRDQRPQTVTSKREATILSILDFNQARPVIKAHSNVKYGNPRPMEKQAA